MHPSSVDQERSSRRTPGHGSMARYRHGCRCQPCKDAAAHRQADYMARRRASAHDALQCSAPDCTSTRKGHGLCTKHLKRKQKADGTWKPSPSDAWDTPARLAKYKTRKATIRGAAPAGANFTVQDLLDRDGRACGICHADILDVRYPDMASASIDHIVPISRGGEHSMENARATHLWCNISRGNRT